MTNTVLTNEQIMHLWDTRVGDPTECMPLVDSDKTAFALAIEQAVLQSEQVQAWKRDAERLNWIEEQFGVDIACNNHNEWWVDWAEGYVEATSMRDAIDAALESKEISVHELNTN